MKVIGRNVKLCMGKLEQNKEKNKEGEWKEGEGQQAENGESNVCK